MGEIKRIGQEYIIEFYARGLKYQQKAGPDFDVAEKTLKTIEEKIANGEAAIIVRDVDYDIFFNDFLDQCGNLHTLKTVSRFRLLVSDFSQFLSLKFPNLKKLSEITPSVIELYKSNLLRDRNIKPKVFNLTLILLRDIMQYAIKLGLLNSNPTLHIKFLPVRSYKIKILDDREIKRLFDSAGNLKHILEFMITTGLSKNELLALSWKSVDAERKVLIRPVHAENFVEVHVPLVPRAIEILGGQDHVDSESLVFSINKNELESLHRGIVSDRVLRHIFAINLIKKGVPLTLLYRFLGYADIARVLPYFSFLAQDFNKI